MKNKEPKRHVKNHVLFLFSIFQDNQKEFVWIATTTGTKLHDDDRVFVDCNFRQLIKRSGDITCIIPVYSNYDCCNSFDNPKEPESYLSEVYKRIKTGIKRADFEYEFFNGAYGGSLFCFAFRSDIETIRNLKEQIKTAKYINIPKGTEFGFFSSFQGAG